MKKKYICLFILLFYALSLTIFTLVRVYQIKESITTKRIIEEKEEEKIVIDNQIFEYNTDVYLKKIINEETNIKIDTLTLGDNTINYNNYVVNYKIVDTQKPLISGSSTITVEKGKEVNIVNKFMCGDNYDDNPNCYIEGGFDFNKTGTYDLKYVATDTSGNTSSKNFKLKVVDKKPASTSKKVTKVKLSEYIKKYKNENTMIGIDVSAWQDNIDYKKAKKDGVEFVIIRIGYGHTSKGTIVEDKWYKNNIEKAKKEGLPVGLYFYSYAKSEEEAREQARWIVSKLNGTSLELPIAFDWENWSSFNKYKVSFKHLNDICYAFIDEVEKNGYKGSLYSSAFYLNRIWKQPENTWLAYYTDNNDFSKPYNIWQVSSKGKVDGISGAVDVDILYKQKN